MSPADLVAERRAELERRIAALSPEKRAQLERANSGDQQPRAERRSGVHRRVPVSPVPMSFAQELLWLLDRAQPGMHGYNVPRSARLRGKLDVAALQAALDEIVARHEILRTTFDMVGDEPRQIVHPPSPVPLPITDLRDRGAEQRDEEAVALVRDLSRRPFDLSSDAQLRASLIRLGDEDHVLLLESHHIASDGWSRNILMRELSVIYDARRRGVDHGLEPLPVQYGDYAIWQRRTLQGETLEQHLAFWRETLRDAPSLIELPTDRPRPVNPGFDGAVRTRMFAPEKLERLREMSRAHGTTLFVTLLAAFDVLLARLSGQDDIVIGSPTAGRSQEATEGLIGYFVNMVVLRTRLTDDPTFSELVSRVRETTLSAFEHQDVPYEKLAVELQRDREAARNGLFQVTFTLQDSEQRSMQLPGLRIEPFGRGRGATKFDLTLAMHEQEGGLRASMEYRTDLFDASTIDRMLAHFGTLLDAVSRAPGTRVSELPVLTAAEERQLLVEWNGPEPDYPRDAAVHELFTAHAERTPGAVAISTSKGAALTYGELDARSNQLAWHLRSMGVVSQSVVAICIEPSPNLIVAMLAALKAGATYLTLDPSYPADRLAFMVEDSRAIAIVSGGTSLPMAVPESVARVSMVADAALIAASPLRAPDTSTTGANVANIMYTSGSTGKPKGTLLPHRGISRLVLNTNYMQLDASDVTAQMASPSFDAMNLEVWAALLNGARVTIIPRDVMLDPRLLQEELQHSGVTTMFLTTAVFNQISRVAPDALRSLKYLFFGGEASDPESVRRVLEHGAPANLVHVYGPTECSVFAMWHPVTSVAPDATTVPIGRAIANTRAYVLDRHRRLAPIGVPGELYLGGDGTALGYLNRPELTDEKFVQNPLDPTSSERLYRTGDIVRWRAEGAIEFIGRVDNQVKIRGVRIELGEIEAVLSADAEVSESLAMVRDVAPGDSRLVCYYVPVPGATPDPVRLRVALRRVLPQLMMPSAIVPVERFPLTPNGKIDRKALPLPDATQARAVRYKQPRTTIEHEMVQIWERLLDKRPIGIRDDFFELGGHSLLAVRMLAEVARLRGRHVPLAWLFESSTIESLVARIDADLFATKEPPLVALQSDKPGTPIAFVHGDGHGGGWYCRRLAPLIAPNSPFYVLPTLGSESDYQSWYIETMAERHVFELRKVQPKGPYRLAGFCVGGLIALEMARQLSAAGEMVERLIVIDSAATNARLRWVKPIISLVPGFLAKRRLARQATMVKRLRRYDTRIRQVMRLDLSRQLLWTKNNIVRRWQRLMLYLNPVAKPPHSATQITDATGTLTPPRREAPGDGVMRIQERAGLLYIPGYFHGRIDLISSERSAEIKRRDPTRDFWRVAKEVRVHPIFAPHISLITNELPAMAEVLRRILDRED